MLMKKEEAAEYLGITPNLLVAEAREGKLPRVRLGKRTYRYRREDLDAYIESCLTISLGEEPSPKEE